MSSVFDRDNGKIIIEYWCKPRTPDDVSPLKVSHFIEIYIHTDTATTSSTLSDAAPSSTSSIVSKSYLPWFQTDGTSRRILVKCYSALVSVADAVIKTRHENNFMDGESSASGGGGGGGVPIDTLIHPTCIDVELLLKHVTKNHAKRILSKISSVVHSLDGIHASDFVDQDLQQQQQQQASSPQPIPEPPHGSPTQSHQVSEICLMATLAQKSWITFSVDIKTGKISISETTTLHQQQQSSSISSPTTPTLSKISATRLQLAEHIIRTNIENAWNALSFLRCSVNRDGGGER